MCQLLYGVDYRVQGLISPLPMAMRGKYTHTHIIHQEKGSAGQVTYVRSPSS